MHHVIHGPAEEGAYRAHLEFLRAVSSPSAMIAFVVDAATDHGLDIE
jgi:hypothetical protein